MSRTGLLVLLLVLALVALPTWPYSSGWGVGYYPSGLLVLLLVVVLFALPAGRRDLP